MAAPHIGFNWQERDYKIRPPLRVEMGRIGITLPAPNKAENIAYDQPYYGNSTDPEFIKQFGNGEIKDAIDSINDQLLAAGTGAGAAELAVVCTEMDADIAATIAKIAGSSTDLTGIHAHKKRAIQNPDNPDIKISTPPRMMIIPGYTAWQSGPGEVNPIIAELPGVLGALFAVAFVDGPSSNYTEAVAWRDTIASDRIIPVETAVKKQSSDGTIYTAPASPCLAGLQIQTDHIHGGNPFHVAGNRPIFGIVGPARDVAFNLIEGSLEGQKLFGKQIGFIEAGDSGADASIGESGFLYVGAHTASQTERFRFYNKRRGNDFISLTMMRTLRSMLVKNNLDYPTAVNYTQTVKSFLSDLVAKGYLLGADVYMDEIHNTPESWRQGKLTVNYDIEVPSVFVRGEFINSPNRQAVEDTISQAISALESNSLNTSYL